MKAIIFDSGTIISFSMNGLFNELRGLRKLFNGKFLITPQVKEEIVDVPLKIKKFELEALMSKKLIDEGVLELPRSVGVQNPELARRTNELIGIADKLFSSKGRYIKLIGPGEASCLALSKILTDKGIKNIVAIDERTMRTLVEAPQNLQKLLERKLHVPIKINSRNYEAFKGFKIIRSTELIYVAYKKGIINLKGPRVLDALLYAMKSKGCAISKEEIEEIKKMDLKTSFK